MKIIADKTIQEAAQTITDLLTSYHANIDKALRGSDNGRVRVSMGIVFTPDEAEVSFSFVGEKISIKTQMKNVQAELPLQKPQDADRVYRMGDNA